MYAFIANYNIILHVTNITLFDTILTNIVYYCSYGAFSRYMVFKEFLSI